MADYSATPFLGKTFGVTVEQLNKSFDGVPGAQGRQSSRCNPGEIFVHHGPQRFGQEVLLKHIVGLETPTSGRVLIGDFDASDPETRERGPPRPRLPGRRAVQLDDGL